jgi:hypothetical protein
MAEHEIVFFGFRKLIWDFIRNASRPPTNRELAAHLYAGVRDGGPKNSLNSIRAQISTMNLMLEPHGLCIIGLRRNFSRGYRVVEIEDAGTAGFLGPKYLERPRTLSDLWGCPVPDFWARQPRRLPVGMSARVVLEKEPVREALPSPRVGGMEQWRQDKNVDGVSPRRSGKTREFATRYGPSQNRRSSQR